jgi:dTDP-4-dehydrorhamnose reductase
MPADADFVYLVLINARSGKPIELDEPGTGVTPTSIDEVATTITHFVEANRSLERQILNPATAEVPTYRGFAKTLLPLSQSNSQVLVKDDAPRCNHVLDTSRIRATLKTPVPPLAGHLKRMVEFG